MREWLASGGSGWVSILTGVITSGIILGLIKVFPERRQINARTVTEGATAASLLTTQAIAMVKEARESADARVAEANERIRLVTEQATERVRAAEKAEAEEESQHKVCQEENLAYAREIGHLVRRLAQWEDWAVEGRDPPPPLRGDGTDGTH